MAQPRLIEDFVPYDESFQWKLHDAYFASRGTAPWDHTIPSAATSNYPMARQHALLFLDVIDELRGSGRLGDDEPVHVLEVGGGNGLFAYNFIQALGAACGERGARLLPRLRYVLSDYSLETPRAAMRTGPLRLLGRGATVLPARFDLGGSGGVETADGPLAARFSLVVANYVCDAVRVKVLRKAGGAFLQKHLRLELPPLLLARRQQEPLEAWLADPPEGLSRRFDRRADWRPVDLDAVFPHPLHAQAARAAVRRLDEATFTYPTPFMEFLRGLDRLMLPGGLCLVADYGYCREQDMAGSKDETPQIFSNALGHGVYFRLLEVFARAAGWDAAVTSDPASQLHCAALRLMPAAPRSFHSAFVETHVAEQAGEDLLDFGAEARALESEGDYTGAARFCRRGLALDRNETSLRVRLAICLLRSGSLGEGVRAFLGRFPEAPLSEEQDLADFLARAESHYRAGRFLPAARHYQRGLRLQPGNPRWYCRLGQSLLDAGYARDALFALLEGRRLGAAEHDFDFELGRCCAARGQHRNALRFYRRALGWGERAGVHRMIGISFLALGKRGDARDSFRRSLELDPSDERAKKGLALAAEGP